MQTFKKWWIPEIIFTSICIYGAWYGAFSISARHSDIRDLALSSSIPWHTLQLWTENDLLFWSSASRRYVKENPETSQNKFQDVGKGRSRRNGVFFRRHLGLSDCSSWPLEGFEYQGLINLEAPSGKKNWDPPKKKSQQWAKFVK